MVQQFRWYKSLKEHLKCRFLQLKSKELWMVLHVWRFVSSSPFNPKIKLSKKDDKLTRINELDRLSITNANTAGATISINAQRRPIASEIRPLSKLPNGWPIHVKLAANWMKRFIRIYNHLPFRIHLFQIDFVFSNSHSQDASLAEIWMVSFGFKSEAIPTNDAITSVDKPSNRFLFTIIELLITVTMT